MTIVGVMYLIEYFMGCFAVGIYSVLGLGLTFGRYGSPAVGVGIIIGALFYFIVFGYFAKIWFNWLKMDTEETRVKLITYFRVGFYMVVVCTVGMGVFVFLGITQMIGRGEFGPQFIPMLIVYCFYCWLYHYYLKVAIRFSKQPIV